MVLGGVAVAVCAAAVVMLAGKDPVAKEGATWPVTKVALARVELAAAPRQQRAVGELEAASQVQVAAEVTGRITAIAFESGQVVKAGQLLVQLNDAPEQASRKRLQAQLRNAETLLGRVRTLREQNVATQEQLDNALTAVAMAKGELQQVDAVIAQKSIRAPFAGTLGIRQVHQGQYLTAGDAVVNLVDSARLHVNFSLNEQAAPQLRVGQHLTLSVDALPDQPLAARINAVDPVISPSRLVQVQATLANPEGLLQPGMYASVQVNALAAPQVLSVPETAITYTAYGQTVFVASDNGGQVLAVHRVQVSTGERWQGRVEITAGLKEGEQVVVSGQLRLSDGMPVEQASQDSLKASEEGRRS